MVTGVVIFLALIMFVLVPVNASAKKHCQYGCCAAVIGGVCAGACCPKPEPKCSVSYCGCEAWKTGADKSAQDCNSNNWKPCRTSNVATTCLDYCANVKCSNCKHGEDPGHCGLPKSEPDSIAQQEENFEEE